MISDTHNVVFAGKNFFKTLGQGVSVTNELLHVLMHSVGGCDGLRPVDPPKSTRVVDHPLDHDGNELGMNVVLMLKQVALGPIKLGRNLLRRYMTSTVLSHVWNEGYDESQRLGH